MYPEGEPGYHPGLDVIGSIKIFLGEKIDNYFNNNYTTNSIRSFLEQLIINLEFKNYKHWFDLLQPTTNPLSFENNGVEVYSELFTNQIIKNIRIILFDFEIEILKIKNINQIINEENTSSIKTLIEQLNTRIENISVEHNLKTINIDNLTIKNLIENLKQIHINLANLLFEEFEKNGDIKSILISIFTIGFDDNIVELEDTYEEKKQKILENKIKFQEELGIPKNIKDDELVKIVLKKYIKIITTQINKIWDTLESKWGAQAGGSLGSRKKITKKKNKKYNLKKKSKKNKSIKKSKTKKNK